MANRMIVHKIHRLTLVRKGHATAKHPDMRRGVVEVVKATETRPTSWDDAFDQILDVDRQLGIKQQPRRVDLPPGVNFEDAVKMLLHS